ncbi:hypothetical protein BHE74_00005951 [Ensete ventricosum]|nr:hypothetical protein BHE74_00005951 [Ensete ventricosum]
MSMSRVVSALLPYDLFGSPRFDGDCMALDDAIHRASPPIIVHCSWMSGVPSRAQSVDHASGRMSLVFSHSESRSVKILARRSRVLDRSSGDSRSTAVLSSSRGVAPANSGAVEALVAMQSCFNIDSTMTTRRLVEVRKNYYIPLEYELHVPLLGECPYDAFLSGFSLSTDALEVGLMFPLHPMIEACLDGWQISPSQMAPNSCFPSEWKSQTVNNSVPMLLANETELVEILRGIFYASRGVKDMNEAWLAEAGLSQPPEVCFFIFVRYSGFFLIVPCCAEMFNIGKMKFDGGANSGSTVPSTTSAFGPIDVAGSMVEKRPSTSEGASLRKRSRKAAPKQPADASESATRAPAEKGKELVEVEEALEWGYTIRDLCKVEDREGAERYFASIMMRLKTIEGEDPLMPR